MTTHTPQIVHRSNHGLHVATAGERGQIFREMEIARQVQARLFPSEQRSYPGLEYFGAWRAARGVSGDYLDYLELSEGNLGIAIGDVAGKGVSAALLMSSLHSMVRALGISRGSSLREIAAAVNGHFLRVSPENCFASLFLARYDPARRKLRYLNAGHEPPFVLRQAGNRLKRIDLPSGGPVIGLLHTAEYTEESMPLECGDLIVAYTDGICDLRSRSGEEWGKQRLVDAVSRHAELGVREMVAQIMAEMDAFSSGEPQFDDMTLWIARVGPAEAIRPVEDSVEDDVPSEAVACAA